GQPALIGVEPPLEHPLRLVLLGRNEPDRVLRKTFWGLVGFDQRLKAIFVLIDVDAPDLIDGLLYCRHSSLRSRFQGPRVGFVGYGDVLARISPLPVTPCWPFEPFERP